MVSNMTALGFSVAFSIISFVAIGYNMVRMAPYIKPGASVGARGFYALYLRPDEFKDPKGVVFRNRYYVSLVVFVISLVVLVAVILPMPEGG
jgi:hypothetical protein